MLSSRPLLKVKLLAPLLESNRKPTKVRVLTASEKTAKYPVNAGSAKGQKRDHCRRDPFPHFCRIPGINSTQTLRRSMAGPKHYPEGPSTQYLRTLVPKTIPLMVFATRVLKYWVLGPSGLCKIMTFWVMFRASGPLFSRTFGVQVALHGTGLQLCSATSKE